MQLLKRTRVWQQESLACASQVCNYRSTHKIMQAAVSIAYAVPVAIDLLDNELMYQAFVLSATMGLVLLGEFSRCWILCVSWATKKTLILRSICNADTLALWKCQIILAPPRFQNATHFIRDSPDPLAGRNSCTAFNFPLIGTSNESRRLQESLKRSDVTLMQLMEVI